MSVALRSHSNAVKISPPRHNVRATQRWRGGKIPQAASLCRMLSVEFRRADNAVSHSDSLLFRFTSILRIQASQPSVLGNDMPRLVKTDHPRTRAHYSTPCAERRPCSLVVVAWLRGQRLRLRLWPVTNCLHRVDESPHNCGQPSVSENRFPNIPFVRPL